MLRLSVPASLWLTRIYFPFDADAVSAGIPARGHSQSGTRSRTQSTLEPLLCCFQVFPCSCNLRTFLGCSVFVSLAILAISVIAVISKLAGENKQRRIKASPQPLRRGYKILVQWIVLAQKDKKLSSLH